MAIIDPHRLIRRASVSARLVAAGVAAGLCFVLVDAALRTDFNVPGSSHWPGVLGLYFATGALVGVVGSLLHVVTDWARRVLLRRDASRGADLVSPILLGGLSAASVVPTAKDTFSGAAISETLLGSVGPPVFVLAAAGVIGLATWRLQKEFSRLDANHRPSKLVLGALLGVAAASLIVDRNVYPALYEQLHALLEYIAFLAFFVLALLLLTTKGGSRLCIWVGATGLCWLTLFLGSHSVRTNLDRMLTHAWLDEVYAGRMLRRFYEAESFLRDPGRKDGVEMLRVADLKERFSIPSDKLHPRWRARANPTGGMPRGRRSLASYNVVVFYVDTLRSDVAHDPNIMPNASAFASTALDFRRAYATGSDTLRSLPGLTGGNYNLLRTHENDLCKVAARAPHESSLIIAKSARTFLKKLRPAFDFEKVVEVPDHEQGRRVWGYGADRSTAEQIVTEALRYLEALPAQKPFFTWLFQFDQHNWRELEETHITAIKKKYGVPSVGALNSRYRAVATDIDAQFARLLEGLERLGRTDDTVVLFVSDHGEGLGRGGFWVHSVFLWESLIRVPLMLRVPGVKAQRIDTAVSLVDVAPTLSRFLNPKASMAGYHGQDLIWHVADGPFERRLPVMFAAALSDELVRIGMLDPERDSRKLVVRLEAAMPEIYDVVADPEEETNLAETESRLTRRLLTDIASSPLFPRERDDFSMLETRD